MKLLSGQTLTLKSDTVYNELVEIDGTLIFDPTQNVTLTVSKNIILTGKLIMKPNPDVNHIIRFIAINENNFVGGGDQVLASDIGMWVMGAGQLDLLCSLQTGWNFGLDPATHIDEIIALAIKQPRNVRIEGTATGQSHIFIKSTKPQIIKYVGFQYMGPRKDLNNDGVKELVTGRYCIHFHHSGDGSRGSIIEGCIARDCNNHCFVPHGSHGITMRGNVAQNVLETAFWYDLGHKTNDLIWENNMVAKVGYVPRSQDQDSGGAPTFGAGGFVLGSGDGNICRGNVVAYTSGSTTQSAAYNWPELRNDSDNTLQLESTWIFENNIAINCPMGLGVWQNNRLHHVVRNTTIINCPIALQHGAYANQYLYKGMRIIGGYIDIRAASVTTNRVRFEDMDINAAGGDYCVIMNEGPFLDDNPPAGTAPILFLHCKFTNYNKKAIINQNPGPGWKYADVVDCGLSYDKYQVTVAKEAIRVQEGNKAWKITRADVTPIALFAPTNWGTGTGLLAQYYASDFKTLLLSRNEPNINLFDITHPSVHYKVPASFCARWTGKIQPQYSEPYNFIVNAGGGFRLWIGDMVKPVLDKWEERYPSEVKSGQYNLTEGKLYDIKLEYLNQDDRSQCLLEWSSTSLKREFIPMSQLYPGDVVVPPPPPVNQPPTCEAGLDQTIEVSTMLYGTGKDPEGGQLAYKWEQVSGTTAVIVSPSSASTKVTGLAKGENVFRLTVTDDKGSSASDEVKVVVK